MTIWEKRRIITFSRKQRRHKIVLSRVKAGDTEVCP